VGPRSPLHLTSLKGGDPNPRPFFIMRFIMRLSLKRGAVYGDTSGSDSIYWCTRERAHLRPCSRTPARGFCPIRVGLLFCCRPIATL
jgi:hypothetical protein